MKKLVLSLAIIGFSLVGYNTTFASDCKEVEFSNGKVCVSIEKESSSTFSLNTEVENGSSNLRCGILLSDNTYKDLGDCNSEFTLSSKKELLVKLFIKMNGSIPTDWDGKPGDSSVWNFPQWKYNFGEGERSDSSSSDNDDDSEDGDLDNFYIGASPSSPDKNERTDITIKARDNDDDTIDDYRGTIRFKVERKSGSSRVSASSSTYSLAKTSYTFSSSNDGEKKFTDLVKFSSNYEYRLVVYDDEDTRIKNYKIFNIGSSSSSSSEDVDNFYVTTDDSTPSTSQRVNLNIKARDDSNSTVTDYTNEVDFKVYYRTSLSSSWIQTTSSSYFELDSDYEDGYDFSSSDDGYATLNNAIKFKKNYDFKVRVYDTDDTSVYGEKIFYVGNSSSSSSSDDVDNFYVTTDDTTPQTSQRVDLTIRARDDSNDTVSDYTNNVRFTVYYRSSSSSSRTTTTSSSYFELDSDYEDGYDFTSSDDGYVTLGNAIKFKLDYDYKVRVYDEDDSSIYGERVFYVGETSASSDSEDINSFTVTTDDSTPTTSQRVDLNIRALDSNSTTITEYDNGVTFAVYYRKSDADTRHQTTSSSYFELDSDYENGYDFSSSDDGYVILRDAIKFYKNYDFKVRVYDEDDSSSYGEKIFYVGDSAAYSDTLDNFYIGAYPSSPSTNERIDITVKARNSSDYLLESYYGVVKFKVEKKSGSSRVSASSTTEYTLNKTSYTFGLTDYAQKSFTDLLKFKTENEFRLVVYDADNTSIMSYLYFDLGSTTSSNVDGFSSKELSTVESIYDSRSVTIAKMKSLYPSLKTNQTWITMSNNLQTQMKYIINNSRAYDTYEEFNAAFEEWYTYSITHK